MAEVPKDIMEAARQWAVARKNVLGMTVADQGYMVALNALSEAEDALSLLSERERRTAQGVTFPVPRGGIDPDWQAVAILGRRKFHKLEKAARLVVTETDRIHDNEPWPVKYRAPYEAITRLRVVLAEVAAPSLSTSAGGEERG